MGYKEAYEAAKKSGAVKSLKPEFMKWEEEGESIVGRFKGIIKVQSTMSAAEYNHYIFETDDGMVKFPLSGYNDKEIGTQLRLNHIYFIKYVGKQKLTGGNEMKVFEAEEVKDFEELETSTEDIPF